MSLITIRRVSQELSRAGLIYSLAGKGSFVKETRPSGAPGPRRKNIVYLSDHIQDFHDLRVFANLEEFFSPLHYDLVVKEGRFDIHQHIDRLEHLSAETTAGLVIRHWLRDYAPATKILRRFSFPVLFVSHPIHGEGFHYVHPADENSIDQCLSFFKTRAPEKVAVVAPGAGLLETDRNLVEKTREVFAQADALSLDPASELRDSWEYRDRPEEISRKLVSEYLERSELPELFLCSNDYAATGTFLALRDRNISVPEMTSLFAISDGGRYFAKMTDRKISGIDKQTAMLGWVAAQNLFTAIQNPRLPVLRTEIPGVLLAGDTLHEKFPWHSAALD
ncbi:MAG: substrate-binding domain-containing protein [Spirochaetia bacterium]|nr:substrate-binding domain-containing protein [Spirochaetia bacterium]